MLTNIMMAGSILNFLGDLCTGSTTQPAATGTNDFDTIVKNSMANSLKTDLTGNVAQADTLNPNASGGNIYLEALRKGLLAKGKSLDKIYLKDSDIDALAVFLNQCGYNKMDVKKCIEKLQQNHSDGKIRLSDFFSEIEKYSFSSSSVSSAKKFNYPVFLESSIIPKIESALKDLGLSLKDADNTLNAARSASGGLDLNKLIAELKTVGNRINRQDNKAEDKISAAKFLEKHQGLGLNITPDKETGRVSIGGFISALEQFRDGVSGKTQKTDGHNLKSYDKLDANTTGSGTAKLPMDVKSSIDRIIERAVAPDDKFELKLSGPSLLQLKADSLRNKEKTSGNSHIFQGDQMAESVKKAGKQTTNNGNEGARNADSARQDSSGRIHDLNELSSYKKDANTEKDNKDLKSKSPDIIQQGTPSVKFETLSSALHNRSNENFLPANTIEQLAKQISGSVARGDKIINLQLTPPELGTVKLSLEIKDGTLRLGMIAESASAKEVLLNNSHELKNMLSDQGIKLERLDIQVEPDLGRALTDLNKGFGQEHKQNQETDDGHGLFPVGDVKENISSDIQNRAVKDYLVDLTA